jgi:lipopolysaccharide/colanic/teichoic acid biosynthesis glycosyltransferase
MKRAFDILVSLLALPILLPVMLATALLVRARLGSPVLFSQERPGRRGRIFTLWKFRTMTEACGPDGKPRTDQERLTRFGRWLRATSLDELPELWNILRGDMSLVGPRPLLVEYLACYSPGEARRHEVRPGLTGWAQINGRNALTWQEKFRLDVWYVDHRTFWLDLKIILLTARRVFRREGISAAGEATMPRFTGTRALDSKG